MELKFLTEADKPRYHEELLHLLRESDNDFLPPLSQRCSTSDQAFTQKAENADGVLSYYDSMCKQSILIALIENKVAGFVSFRENDACGKTPNIYVSTLVVAQWARGKGLTRVMYEHLFGDAFADRHAYTRTWSTNVAHTKILARFGFAEQKRIKDDRGEGVDTVYYERLATPTVAAD